MGVGAPSVPSAASASLILLESSSLRFKNLFCKEFLLFKSPLKD